MSDRGLLLVALALPAGLLLALGIRAVWRARARMIFEAQSWPEQIAVLQPDRPLTLPPVRPLRAERGSSRIVRFRERLEG